MITGIHHVTCLADDPKATVAFYSGILGLRLVKKTVNFDDSSRYHLYFGDWAGTPGTLLTFFPLPGVRPGKIGTGQVAQIVLSIPAGSESFWRERLENFGFDVEVNRLNERMFSFQDPDGLPLAMLARETPGPGFALPPIGEENAIRGIHGVTLATTREDELRALLADDLGLASPTNLNPFYRAGDAVLLIKPDTADMSRGVAGIGTVHHIALKVAGDTELASSRDNLISRNHTVTEIKDRRYFRSVYFREIGGILFELATDGPGFLVDESFETLGRSLSLPPWFESERVAIESKLPDLPFVDFSNLGA